MNDVVTVLDGAMGTNLVDAGMVRGSCVEKWILENKNIVINLQKAYIKAGAQIIYTPTFGANPTVLQNYGLEKMTRSINNELVSVSREAAKNTDVLVAGDMSSTGILPLPYGTGTYEEIFESFFEQASALEQSGVDLFVIETSSNLYEAQVAVDAVKSVSAKDIFVTFTVGKSGKTLAGDDMRAALVTLQSRGIKAFGINCSEGVETVCNVIKEIAPYAEIPLIAKPNAGVPHISGGNDVYESDEKSFSEWGKRLVSAGASFVGGCCGTKPSHIQALADSVRGMKTGKSVNEKTYATLSNAVFEITSEMRIPERVVCDDSLIFALPDVGDADIYNIYVENTEETANLAEAAISFELPVMLSAPDAKTLEYAVRRFNGRCVLSPDMDIDEGMLRVLKEKYGAIDLVIEKRK